MQDIKKVTVKVPQAYLDFINQIFEIEKKANNLKEERYGLLNAKLSLMRKNFQLDVWGKNLTNTQYRAFMFESGPAAFAQPGKPMQLGVNVSYNW